MILLATIQCSIYTYTLLLYCSLGDIGPMRPSFEQTQKRITRPCYLPNPKHQSQVALKKKISEYMSMYFYGSNLGPPGWGPS